MKSIFQSIATVFILFCNCHVIAQDESPFPESFNDIKKEKTIQIIFSYDKMYFGDYDNEQEFIDANVKKYNAQKSGKGEIWLKEWGEKKNKSEEMFIWELNRALSKNKGIVFSKDKEEARYAFVISPEIVDVGWSMDYFLTEWSGTMEYSISLCKSDDIQNPLDIYKPKKLMLLGTVIGKKKRMRVLYQGAANGLSQDLLEFIFNGQE